VQFIIEPMYFSGVGTNAKQGFDETPKIEINSKGRDKSEADERARAQAKADIQALVQMVDETEQFIHQSRQQMEQRRADGGDVAEMEKIIHNAEKLLKNGKWRIGLYQKVKNAEDLKEVERKIDAEEMKRKSQPG
jgi:23S rRNA A1618 N6-methylase RlmF